MKKIIIIITLIATSVVFTSCEKEEPFVYDCECFTMLERSYAMTMNEPNKYYITIVKSCSAVPHKYQVEWEYWVKYYNGDVVCDDTVFKIIDKIY